MTLSVDGAVYYLWEQNSNITCLDCAVQTISPESSDTLVVRGWIGNCPGIANVPVIVNPRPDVEINGDTLICSEYAINLVASGGTTYSWSTGDASWYITVQPEESTMYAVSSAIGNCYDTAYINVNTLPLPEIFAGNDTSISLGESVQLMVESEYNLSWSWSETISCTNCENPIVTPGITTDYCVQATDTNGCVASDCLKVNVEEFCDRFFIPNVFAPEAGGNSANDCFRIFGEECFNSTMLRVFDRWGGLVFESDEMGACWDGTVRGEPANSGAYVYQFSGELLNGNVFNRSGNVTIVR